MRKRTCSASGALIFDEELSAIVYGMDIFSLEKRGLWSRENEEHIEYAHTTEKLRALLEAAGFGDVAVRHDCPQGDAGRIFITAKKEVNGDFYG